MIRNYEIYMYQAMESWDAHNENIKDRSMGKVEWYNLYRVYRTMYQSMPRGTFTKPCFSEFQKVYYPTPDPLWVKKYKRSRFGARLIRSLRDYLETLTK